jgi:T-complex protein 1 subunit eta
MMGMQPQIVLLREGTDTSQGKAQLISNINACMAVVECVNTTLGPRGMDKLIHQEGGRVTITNDGATVISLLEIVHPAANTLVDIARSQDAEVGDGTTTVTILAGELLKQCKSFVEDGVHPQVISRAFRQASEFALEKLGEIQTTLDFEDADVKRSTLERCAATTLSSKLIGGSHAEFFSKMVVSACLHLEDSLDLEMIGVKQVQGGSMEDSFLVEGVAFKKCFSYAGFEQQPKKILDAKILALNLELELKSEKENAEIRIDSVEDYQKVVDAEWDIIYDKLEKIVASGATVVLSKLAIGDLATQYFADRDIFCAGRVTEDDMKRVMKATGAQVQSTVNNLIDEVMGSSAVFEEQQVGDERYNLFTGCPATKTATIVLRGGAEQFIEEAERSLHDAIMIVRRTLQHNVVVPGGGAIDMELSRLLRQHAKTIHGKSQFFVNAFAKALEVIPRQLAQNAGFDATELLNKLRHAHATGDMQAGIDIETDGICNTWDKYIWEPALVKRNAITAATEAACLILTIDETVRNPASENEKPGAPGVGGPGGRGGGRGRGMR